MNKSVYLVNFAELRHLSDIVVSSHSIHVQSDSTSHSFTLCQLLSLAMTKPDRPLIAQVMLYSQGFRTAEILAAKIVPFFKLVVESMRSMYVID